MTAVGLLLLFFSALLIWSGVTDKNLASELAAALKGTP